MEGIVDGRAVDRCYFCELLYPGLASCPLCGNRLHYLPAHMEDVEETVIKIAECRAAFRERPSLESAKELLERMHEMGEPSSALEREDLDALRHYFPPQIGAET